MASVGAHGRVTRTVCVYVDRWIDASHRSISLPYTQLAICKAVEECDGGATFQKDAWVRADGGGGISMVLRDGKASRVCSVCCCGRRRWVDFEALGMAGAAVDCPFSADSTRHAGSGSVSHDTYTNSLPHNIASFETPNADLGEGRLQPLGRVRVHAPGGA